MHEPKVSIIVPVYNLESYIEQSVRSLFAQSYQNIEIILVDDGSKDNSLSIIKHLAAEDSRIVYTSQPNGGAAKARNTGLSLATGKYITFVDGDDMLSPNAISDNIGYFEDDIIDWVAFSIRRVDAEGNYIQIKGVYEDFIVSSYESINSESFVPYFYLRKLSGVACAAIYRKTSIDTISFTEGKYYEDSIYFIDLLCNTKHGILSPKGEYLYVDRENSSQKLALDYRHLDSSWYAHKKRMSQYRELFPQYESYYSDEESSFYYFLRNEVAKDNIAAKEVLTLFLRELRTKPKKNYAKEVKFLIYRIVGYERIKRFIARFKKF